jgi:hypothetical protein
MVRGIERTAIFLGDRDRADFVARLGKLAESGALTVCARREGSGSVLWNGNLFRLATSRPPSHNLTQAILGGNYREYIVVLAKHTRLTYVP